MKEEHSYEAELEFIRQQLLQDEELLIIKDFGAGSKKLKKNTRKISDITKYSTSQLKFNKLYQFFCQETPAQYVLELGTCTGLNAHYLSKVTKGVVHSFEGSEALWKKAKEYHKSENIQFNLGEIKTTLPAILAKSSHIDFALLDATHTEPATLHYFESILPYLQNHSIIAVADIHWSRCMESAWVKLINHPKVSLSFDFFECGILYFDPNLPKESYILDI
ncbi:O-methyltransferase [Mongoliitalea lutea]|uniref:O-methyltransferase n=1 Tax=Mongoliitalea lutea TaxID=849756 RepID=UPI001E5C1EBB|nr:class I SAM-dependent methyltransferase [Mongoliitalea lutea]